MDLASHAAACHPIHFLFGSTVKFSRSVVDRMALLLVGPNTIKACVDLNGTPVRELQDVTFHMGSHSVTCYPIRVNAPRPNPSPQARTQLTDPGLMEG